MRTYADNVSVAFVETFDVDMGVAANREYTVRELRELAREWSRVAREGVEGGEAVDKDGEGEDSEVEREEEPQCCSEHGRLGRPGGKKSDEQRRRDKQRSMNANRIGFLVAEHLMGDLAKTQGRMPFSVAAAAEGWKGHDALRQTRRSERHLLPWETTLVLRCRWA